MDTLIAYLLFVSITGTSLYAATRALLSKRDSKSALAWVACCFIPVLGPALYLVFGINRVRQRAREKYHPIHLPDSAATFTEPPGTNLRPYSLVGESVTGMGLHSCDELRMLENGENSFDAMLDDIRTAKSKVYLSTYIFQGDHTGKQFIRALTEAKARGADVRIIVDGLGGVAYPPSVIPLLEENHLRFALFSPLTLIPPALQVNMRNHRKILIVDSRCAYTGGQNISDRHRISLKDNPKCARDLHFRLTGKIVDDLERAFLADWNHCNSQEGEADIQYAPSNENRSESSIWTRMILDGPNENLDRLNEVLNGILALAKRRIWIMTPYFLPLPELVGALQGAILRGVDVKILLPERTNIHLAHYAAQHNLKYILAKGLSVYRQPAPFMHTKAIIIDDIYSFIGSANLDPRSLRLNFELGIEVFSEKLTGQLEEYFERHLRQASVLTEGELTSQPFVIKIRNALAWLLTPYL